MDDILICHKNSQLLQDAYPILIQTLGQWGLQVANEKVQVAQMGTFLGSLIYPDKIVPQKLEIRKDQLHTLNDFQKLLGDINWLRPHFKLTTADLKPLFDILQGDANSNSPGQLIDEGQIALQKVEEAISQQQIHYIDYDQLLAVYVFATHVPTAVLWQKGPLMWIHLSSSPSKV